MNDKVMVMCHQCGTITEFQKCFPGPVYVCSNLGTAQHAKITSLEAELAQLKSKLGVAEKALDDPGNHWHHPSEILTGIRKCTACEALSALRAPGGGGEEK